MNNKFSVFFWLSFFLLGAAGSRPVAQPGGTATLVFPPGCREAITAISFPAQAAPPAVFVSPSNESGAGFEVGGQALGNDYGAVSAEIDFTPAITFTLDVYWHTMPLPARANGRLPAVQWERAC